MLALLAWRNLWRRPQRTFLSLASIAFVVALLVCPLGTFAAGWLFFVDWR